MGVVTAILIALGGLAGTVLMGLLKDEATAWLPSLNRLILATATRRLPEADRDRCAEEWAAHVLEYPGKLSQLFQCLRFLWAGFMLEEFTQDFVNKRLNRAFVVTMVCAPAISWLEPSSEAATIGEHALGFIWFSACALNMWSMLWFIRLRPYIFRRAG